jgi:hypothetical protein
MKQINMNQIKKATFSLALFAALFFAGISQSVAQEAQSANANSNSNVSPALMLSFTGIVNEKAGQLTWVTENETSAKWFVIERSATGSNFDSIGIVMADNNANMTTYNYSDGRLSNGSNYYRLREVDNDNISRYSKIISLKDAEVVAQVQVYPNPASAVVNFAVNSHSADQLTVQIYNLAGVLVAVREQSISAGLSSQSMAISNLKSGSYILKVIGKQGTQFTQMFSKI